MPRKSEKLQETLLEGEEKSITPIYKVKTKGFSENFSSYSVAKRNFDSLKRKAVKGQKAVTVTMFLKKGDSWEELDKAQISESFYNE